MPTNREIREYLGHNGRECRVRIRRNGEVWRHGSPEDTDRSRDHWAFVGYDNNIAADMALFGNKTKGFETLQQVPLSKVPAGEYVRRKPDARATYVRGEYDRASRSYSLTDFDDIGREITLPGTSLVWIGFTF
jgi:hypothetical protein